MARKVHEISFAIAGRLATSFRGAFSSASYQMSRLQEETDELKKELKQLEKEHKDGKISTEQFTRAQEKLTAALDRQKKAYQALLQQQSRRKTHMDNRSDATGKIGDTAVMAAPFAGAVVAATDYEEALRRIQIQSELTAQQQQQAFDIIRRAHLSGLGEGMAATTEAYGIMSQTIRNETAEQQQLILQGALAAERYWGAGVMEINRSMFNLTNNFENLSNSEAMDLIISGFRNGLNYADDFLDTLYEYAPQFDSLGYSARQFYAYLEAAKSAGAWNLDKAADAAKEFNIRAKDGSKTTEDAFKALGLNAKQMALDIANGGQAGIRAWNKTIDALNKVQDPVKRNQIGVALFGTQWEDLTEKVILSMKIMENAGSTIDGATQKVVEASTAARNGAPTWTQLGRQIQDTAAVVGNQFLPVVAPMIDSVADAARWVGNFAQEHPRLTSVIVGTTAALIGARIAWFGLRAAWSTAALIGNGLSSIFVRQAAAQTLAATATGRLTLAQRALNIAMRLNPIGMVITAIGLLVTAGIYLYQNWDKVKQAGQQLWLSMKIVFMNLKLAGLEAFQGLMDAAAPIISILPDSIAGSFDSMRQSISSNIAQAQADIRALQREKDLINMAYSPTNRNSIDAARQEQHAMRFAAHGSHRDGLSNVPFDGYRAILHRGERVLTAEENQQYEQMTSWRNVGGQLSASGSKSIVVHLAYAPQIHGGDPAVIEPVLREDKRTLMDQLRSLTRYERMVSYSG
jgi:phage-related minor tail protein